MSNNSNISPTSSSPDSLSSYCTLFEDMSYDPSQWPTAEEIMGYSVGSSNASGPSPASSEEQQQQQHQQQQQPSIAAIDSPLPMPYNHITAWLEAMNSSYASQACSSLFSSTIMPSASQQTLPPTTIQPHQMMIGRPAPAAQQPLWSMSPPSYDTSLQGQQVVSSTSSSSSSSTPPATAEEKGTRLDVDTFAWQAGDAFNKLKLNRSFLYDVLPSWRRLAAAIEVCKRLVQVKYEVPDTCPAQQSIIMQMLLDIGLPSYNLAYESGAFKPSCSQPSSSSSSPEPPVAGPSSLGKRKADSQEHHQAGKRAKTTTACERCRAKKAKCTGTSPCDQCTKAGLDCSFGHRAYRGESKRTTRSRFEDATERFIEKLNLNATEAAAARQRLQTALATYRIRPEDETRKSPSHASTSSSQQ